MPLQAGEVTGGFISDILRPIPAIGLASGVGGGFGLRSAPAIRPSRLGSLRTTPSQISVFPLTLNDHRGLRNGNCFLSPSSRRSNRITPVAANIFRACVFCRRIARCCRIAEMRCTTVSSVALFVPRWLCCLGESANKTFVHADRKTNRL